MTYNKQVEEAKFMNNVYQEDNNVELNITSNPLNPNTGVEKALVSLLMVLSVVIISTVIYKYTSKRTKYFIIIGIILLPTIVKAIETLTIKVSSHVEITKPRKVDQFCYLGTLRENNTIKAISNSQQSIIVSTKFTKEPILQHFYFDYEEGMSFKEFINSKYYPRFLEKLNLAKQYANNEGIDSMGPGKELLDLKYHFNSDLFHQDYQTNEYASLEYFPSPLKYYECDFLGLQKAIKEVLGVDTNTEEEINDAYNNTIVENKMLIDKKGQYI